MNAEHNPFYNLTVPSVKRMQSHRRRLKIALLTAHEKRSSVQAFGRIINDVMTRMSIGKKSTALATLALFGLVVGAGVVGPSASDVAQAEGAATIKRAFARFINLSDEEKSQLQEQFADRVHFRGEGDVMFHGMDDLIAEERDARHADFKASLADSLVEAQAAADLEVVAADEMPVGGFLGKAGRAFGIKMMHHSDEALANLPEDIQAKIKEHEEDMETMHPAKFLTYTNSEGKKVTLGVNANDEPVMKFVEGERGVFPNGPGGPGMMRGHGGPMGWIEKDAQ